MKGPGFFAMAFTLTACVSSRMPLPDTAVVAANTYAQEALAAEPVQVDITPQMNTDTIECRRAAPTGTRIAIQRCVSNAEGSAERDQMLRDIDAIRRQQWQLEAQRQNSFGGVLTPAPSAPAPSPQP